MKYITKNGSDGAPWLAAVRSESSRREIISIHPQYRPVSRKEAEKIYKKTPFPVYVFLHDGSNTGRKVRF